MQSKLCNYWTKAIFAAVLLFLCGPPARGEPPVKFTYQGNLRQQGFLVTGQRQMIFRLYTSSYAPTEVWTSPAYNTQVSTGVFFALLEPAGIDWQNNLWLELEIEGVKLSPREEMASAPYSINTLLHSGKRYTSAASTPTVPAVSGDLWYDSSANVIKFWNGAVWVPTSGSGLPGPHAVTHANGGSDAITSLGTHAVTGYITISSSVTAGWYYGDGAGLNNLNASNIMSGLLSGNRIGDVIVSTHIVDGSIFNQDIANLAIDRLKLNQSGCGNGQLLKWDNPTLQWICADDNFAGGGETDPLSVHVQDTLQAGTTFYVSSGTVNYFTVNNEMNVLGTARIRGSPASEGLYIDNQGRVGVGNITPGAKIEVTGGTNPGDYLMIIKSGSQTAAWLRKK